MTTTADLKTLFHVPWAPIAITSGVMSSYPMMCVKSKHDKNVNHEYFLQ
jgi:hypothetical protein